MKVLLALDIEYDDRGVEVDPEEVADWQDSLRSSILDGLLSVDVEVAIRGALATYYLSVPDSEVTVSINDVLEVVTPKDKRRRPTFALLKGATIRQVV